MGYEGPARLKDDPNYSNVVQGLADKSDWPQERLNRNHKAIGVAIAAAGVAASSSAAAAVSTGALLKFLLPVAVGVAGATAWWALEGGSDSDANLLTNPPVVEEIEKVAPAVLVEGVEFEKAAAPTEESAEAIVDTKVLPPQVKKPVIGKKLGTLATDAEKNDDVVTKKSELEPQLALLNQARQAGAENKYAEGLAHLETFRQRYPRSPLRVDADMIRVRFLVAAKKPEKALKEVDLLLSLSNLSAKRGVLLRMRGDLLRQMGSCERAAEAYRRALGVGLSSNDERAARAGLKNCGQL